MGKTCTVQQYKGVSLDGTCIEGSDKKYYCKSGDYCYPVENPQYGNPSVPCPPDVVPEPQPEAGAEVDASTEGTGGGSAGESDSSCSLGAGGLARRATLASAVLAVLAALAWAARRRKPID